MGARHGVHAINPGDELLEVLIDEVKGLREDLARYNAPAAPEPPAPEPEEQATSEIEIREPAAAGASAGEAQPVAIAEPAPAKKAAARKAAKPATSKET